MNLASVMRNLEHIRTKKIPGRPGHWEVAENSPKRLIVVHIPEKNSKDKRFHDREHYIEKHVDADYEAYIRTSPYWKVFQRNAFHDCASIGQVDADMRWRVSVRKEPELANVTELSEKARLVKWAVDSDIQYHIDYENEHAMVFGEITKALFPVKIGENGLLDTSDWGLTIEREGVAAEVHYLDEHGRWKMVSTHPRSYFRNWQLQEGDTIERGLSDYSVEKFKEHVR